jgi:hypothetical protein
MGFCQVLLDDRALRKLPRQVPVRRVGLGDHHDARGLAVEAVHDAGALDAADAAQAARAVREERMDQGVLARAGARVHDHARRLVDGQHRAVLEEDVELDVDRAQQGGHHVGKGELKDVAGVDRGLAPDRGPP